MIRLILIFTFLIVNLSQLSLAKIASVIGNPSTEEIYFEVNKDSNTFVWAPYYFARGFISLEDDTLIEYLCSSKYNKDGEYAIKFFDQGLDHPYHDDYNLSEKDMNAMSVKDWFSSDIDL